MAPPADQPSSRQGEHLPLLKQSSCAVRYWVEEAEVQLDDSAPMEECTPRGWMALRARWRA